MEEDKVLKSAHDLVTEITNKHTEINRLGAFINVYKTSNITLMKKQGLKVEINYKKDKDLYDFIIKNLKTRREKLIKELETMVS